MGSQVIAHLRQYSKEHCSGAELQVVVSLLTLLISSNTRDLGSTHDETSIGTENH